MSGNISYFECARCLHRAKQKSDMRKHLEKQKKCMFHNKQFADLSDQEIFDLSMIKKLENSYQNNHHLQQQDCLTNQYNQVIQSNTNSQSNPTELVELENPVKSYMCDVCHKHYSRLSVLERHKNTSCKGSVQVYVAKPVPETPKVIQNNIIGDNNVINNTLNNITNNINFVNINVVKGIDENWDVSKFTPEMILFLLFSNSKYTNTLTEILKNDANLNVIMNEDSSNVAVFKKEKGRFVFMDKETVIDDSMEKLYNQLKSFANDIKKNSHDLSFYKEIEPKIATEEKNIELKYENYKNNSDVQKSVSQILTELYMEKRNETIYMNKERLMDSALLLDSKCY